MAFCGHALAGDEPLPPKASETPIVRRIEDIWDITNASTPNRNVFFDLRFRITYTDPHWKLTWVQQNGKGSFFPYDIIPYETPVGSAIRISGPFDLDAPELTQNLLVETLDATDELVVRQAKDLERLASDFDTELVELEAYVETQRMVDSKHLELGVVCEDRQIACRVLVKPPAEIIDYRDRFVRLRGVFVVTPAPNHTREGLALWIAKQEDIQALPDRNAAFDLPATPVAELHKNSTLSRVRIVGLVENQLPGQSLILRDPSGEIILKSEQERPLPNGCAVEIVGYPHYDGYRWTLKHLAYRALPPESLPESIYQSAVPAEPALNFVHDALSLCPEDVAKGLETRLAGSVNYVDPEGRFFYLNDGTGGICISPPEDFDGELQLGEALIVQGRTESGDFTPTIRARSIRFEGTRPLPHPRPVAFGQAASGAEDGNWIRTQGYLSAIQSQAKQHSLELTTAEGTFTAHLPQSETDRLPAIGSILNLTGICRTLGAADLRGAGFELLVPTSQQIHLDAPPERKPFDKPLASIASLQGYRGLQQQVRRIRLKATVLHQEGQQVHLSDATGNILALTPYPIALRPGAVVEAVGIPGRNKARSVLRETIVREIGQPQALNATELNLENGLEPSLDGAFVRLGKAKVLMVRSSPTGPVDLLLQVGQHALNAQLQDAPQARANDPHWDKGSSVAAQGIYQVKFNDDGRPIEAGLILRSPSDIQILEKPPFWNVSKALATVGGLAVALGLGLIWGTVLRRRIQRQNIQLSKHQERQAQLSGANQEIQQHASDFIFTIDLEGNFSSFNPAGERLTGYSQAEALGRKVFDLLDERGQRTLRRALRRAAPQLERRPIQYRIRRQDGSRVWIESNVRFIRDAQEVIGLLAIVRDISSRKLIEVELKRAKEAAEANMRSKDAFLATMSHELRTPLNGVIGMSNLLLDTDLDREQKDLTTTVRYSAESLLVLLNDILDFSTADSGKLAIDNEEFALKRLVHQNIEPLRKEAEAKGLQFALNLDDELPNTLRGDPIRISQALLRLVANAVKFTDEGQIEVSISLLEQNEGKAFVRFAVKDTGPGIPHKVMDRLFTPFSQGDESFARRHGGAGLGLALCQRVIDAMGGTLDVRSAVGEGSIFWFEIPLAIPRQQSTPIQAAPVAANDRWNGPPIRVLIAEDQLVNQRVTQSQLKRLGLESTIAANGVEVLEALKEECYHVIFMDCQMPEMDGFEATRRIRQNPAQRHIHIIALTANSMKGDRERCLQSGMDDYISKPANKAKLLQSLERFAEKLNLPKVS